MEEREPEEEPDETEQPHEYDAPNTSNEGADAAESLREALSKPPESPRTDEPSSTVARSKSMYPLAARFNAMEMLGFNRLFEDMRRSALNPITQIQLNTLGALTREALIPVPKWQNPIKSAYQRQIEEITSALFPRTSMLPDDLFPWLKQFDITPAWMQTFESLNRGLLGSPSATSSSSRRAVSDTSLREADALLDSAEEEDSDDVLPPTLLDAIIEDLESSLADDAEDDPDVLPDDLEGSSGTSDLTPLRALYRLAAHLRPDIRDDPRLHRILRRAAGGSLVATFLVVWLLNPAFFVVLMNVVGVLPMYGVGAAAVDLTLAGGEKPRSSDDTPEDSEDEPDESTED